MVSTRVCIGVVQYLPHHELVCDNSESKVIDSDTVTAVPDDLRRYKCSTRGEVPMYPGVPEMSGMVSLDICWEMPKSVMRT